MSDKRLLTLPTDSEARKEFPLLSGFLKYFPAAAAGAAKLSKLGNDKHNPGQPLHHARWKSMDHGDCIVRHLMDLQDLIAAKDRAGELAVNNLKEQILIEASSLVWRALAYSQQLHEDFGAPLAPSAKLQEQEEQKSPGFAQPDFDSEKSDEKKRIDSDLKNLMESVELCARTNSNHYSCEVCTDFKLKIKELKELQEKIAEKTASIEIYGPNGIIKVSANDYRNMTGYGR